MAKIDIPFRKGYKKSFTDEIFEIFDVPTRNPPTYNLIDANKEPIEGKFYEPELIRVVEKVEQEEKEEEEEEEEEEEAQEQEQENQP